MLRDLNKKVNGAQKIVYDEEFFKTNCSLTHRCYRIVFSLEVLLEYISLLKIKIEGKVTYLSQLRALSKHVNSKLEDDDLVSIKSKRNAIAHDYNPVVLMFKNSEDEEALLDIVMNNILILMGECKEVYDKKEKQDTEESTRTKIPNTEESKIFSS